MAFSRRSSYTTSAALCAGGAPVENDQRRLLLIC